MEVQGEVDCVGEPGRGSEEGGGEGEEVRGKKIWDEVAASG